jgi:alpha-galactosidase
LVTATPVDTLGEHPLLTILFPGVTATPPWFAKTPRRGRCGSSQSSNIHGESLATFAVFVLSDSVMSILTQAEYLIGDLLIRYSAPADNVGAWGLSIIPAALRDRTLAPRERIDAPAVKCLPAPWNETRAWEVDPLVHVHVAGEAYPGGFAQGRTLRNSASTQSLTVRSHTREQRNGKTILRTTLAATSRLICVHELTVDEVSGFVEVLTSAENPTEQSITLEFLSSFSLGGLTPFAADDAAGRLRVHRFRSAWSAEGRHEQCSVEELHLERSWTGHGVRTERFGQTGSLPVNGWFPLAGIEDRVAGVTWLTQLVSPGTWQLEIYRRADQLALAGGGADRLDGEWRKTLRPRERFTAPRAILTVVAGSINEACDRLITGQKGRTATQPMIERNLPVVFNEWCSSWGNPTHDKMVRLADRLKDTGVTYLVIDDGWAERPGDGFQQNGDWIVNRRAFPEGLRATTDAIRARGLVPGIWFEFEAVNPDSAAWSETAHQLHRDGLPLQVGNRRFWNFNDPWVHDFLAKRVLALLRDSGFGYLKVDYNDSIGPGCDGPEAPGENLRQHLEGVQEFFMRLRAELPELVIENCSSGGHRLEASMMALTAMSSFSDAHETPDIPIIAANLGSLVNARQKQIWAVLRATDSADRLYYSLAATFLGRMCLSGDPVALNDSAWAIVQTAIKFYQEVAPIIRDGVHRCHRETGESYQHLQGSQIVTIHAAPQDKLLVVWHRFSGGPDRLCISLPPGAINWRVQRVFAPPELTESIECTGQSLSWKTPTEWSGGVFMLHSS